MKKSQVFVSALLLSLVFSAVMTELSMQVSTRSAMHHINAIDLTDEGMENSYIDSLGEEGSDSNSASTKEEIQAMYGELQSATSVYQYPGYWIFWLQSFVWVFLTTLAVALLQSVWVLRGTQQASVGIDIESN